MIEQEKVDYKVILKDGTTQTMQWFENDELNALGEAIKQFGTNVHDVRPMDKFYVVEYKTTQDGFTRVIEFDSEEVATEFLNEPEVDWVEKAFYYTKEAVIQQFGDRAFAKRMTPGEYEDAWMNYRHRT